MTLLGDQRGVRTEALGIITAGGGLIYRVKFQLNSASFFTTAVCQKISGSCSKVKDDIS